MIAYILDIPRLNAILKFASSDPSRGTLRGATIEKIELKNEIAIRITATDGHGLFTGLFTEESFVNTLYQLQEKHISYDPAAGILYKNDHTTKNKIPFVKTSPGEYPKWRLGTGKEIEPMKRIYAVSFANTSRLFEIQKTLFGQKKETAVPIATHQQKEDTGKTGAIFWFPKEGDGETFVLMMPLRYDFKEGREYLPSEFTIKPLTGEMITENDSLLNGLNSNSKTQNKPSAKNDTLTKKQNDFISLLDYFTFDNQYKTRIYDLKPYKIKTNVIGFTKNNSQKNLWNRILRFGNKHELFKIENNGVNAYAMILNNTNVTNFVKKYDKILKNKDEYFEMQNFTLSGGNSKFIAPEKMTRAEKLKHIQYLKKTDPTEALQFWLRYGTRISRKAFNEA